MLGMGRDRLRKHPRGRTMGIILMLWPPRGIREGRPRRSLEMRRKGRRFDCLLYHPIIVRRAILILL